MTLRWSLFGALVFSTTWLVDGFPAVAQTSEGLIQREVDDAKANSPWRLGPLHLTPSFRLDGGYDSNGLSSADLPQEDVRFAAAPGLRTVAPIRERALVEVSEEVDFVYYKKLEDLRDVFNVTRVGGALGGHRLVFSLFDTFRNEKVRPTSEFDVPTALRSNRLSASTTVALGWRHELTLDYHRGSVSILDSSARVAGVPLQNLLDRTEDDYRARISRRLTGKTSAVLEGFYAVQNFDDDARPRDNASYGALGGFVFTPDTNVEGQVLVGYKKIVPDADFQADFAGLVGSTNIAVELGKRLRLDGVFTRDAIPSVLVNNWFFIENRYGGAVEVFLMENFSVRPRMILGRNTYPRPEEIVTAEGERFTGEVIDRFESYALSFNYYLTTVWGLSIGGDYLRRDSNVRTFDKDRLLLTFGLRTRF